MESTAVHSTSYIAKRVLAFVQQRFNVAHCPLHAQKCVGLNYIDVLSHQFMHIKIQLYWLQVTPRQSPRRNSISAPLVSRKRLVLVVFKE